VGIAFANPLLLFGLAAAALPLVVHLLMRPRPQRIRFPTVTFLQDALATGARVQQLRDRGLLAIRSLLLACAALLLAGPRCDAPPAAVPATGPGALLVVLDDSLSTQYRDIDGAAVSERLLAVAERIVAAHPGRGEGSEVGVLRSSGARLVAPLATDPAAARGALRAPAAHNADTLGPALRRAVAELLKSRSPRRRVAIVTDGAEHAWRTVTPDVLRSPEPIALEVHALAPRARANVAAQAIVPPASTPAGVEGILEAELSDAGPATAARLRLAIGGLGHESSLPVELSADQSTLLRLPTPPAEVGIYPLRVEVEPPDRLLFDQVRFGALVVSRRPTVWLLAFPPASLASDLSMRLYRNLLAPESLPADEQRVALAVLTDEAGLQAAGDAGRPDLVILPSGVSLTRAGRETLRAAVERGARLLLAPSSAPQAVDWDGARRWIAGETPVLESLSPPATITAAQATGRAAGTRVPAEGLAERRLRIAALESGARVHAEFADGSPAILSRPVGGGEVWLLATSPDPAWSDLGIRAAGMITWLDNLAQAAIQTHAPTYYTHGEPWPLADGRLAAANWSPLAQPEGPTGSASADTPPPPGVYRYSEGGEAARMVVVNWPVEESDLEPATRDAVAARVGLEDFAWLQDGAAADDADSGVLRLVQSLADPRRIAVAALLGLLLAEWWMIARGRSHAAAAAPVRGTGTELE